MTCERYYSYRVDRNEADTTWIVNLMFGPTVVNIKTAWTLKGAHRKGKFLAKTANRRLKKERAKR